MKGYSGLTPTVEAIGRLSFSGNVVPRQWRYWLRRENGKVNSVAIDILSELVYWYRPLEVVDEKTGKPAFRKKFKGEKLQKSYQDLADTLGHTKRQISDNAKWLRDLGYITLELETVNAGGTVCNNVLFIDINAAALERITFSLPPSSDTTEEVDLPITFERKTYDVSTEEAITFERKTNTEITPEITTESTLPPIVPQGGRVDENPDSNPSLSSQEEPIPGQTAPDSGAETPAAAPPSGQQASSQKSKRKGRKKGLLLASEDVVGMSTNQIAANYVAIADLWSAIPDPGAKDYVEALYKSYTVKAKAVGRNAGDKKLAAAAYWKLLATDFFGYGREEYRKACAKWCQVNASNRSWPHLYIFLAGSEDGREPYWFQEIEELIAPENDPLVEPKGEEDGTGSVNGEFIGRRQAQSLEAAQAEIAKEFELMQGDVA